MKTFKPRLDLLPEPQRNVWPELANLPRQFVLYGGTAVALRLGHRPSLDFDFFSSEPLNIDGLYQTLSFLGNSTPLQREPDALTVLLERAGPVKISFFGDIRIGCIDPPETTEDRVLQVASLIDLAGTKMKVLLQRVESKDYRDIAAILHAGVSVGEGLAAAQALYAEQFPPAEALKALTYFKGGDLNTLESEITTFLTETVRSFKGSIPVLTKTSARSLTADSRR
jgi:hypothetical protein